MANPSIAGGIIAVVLAVIGFFREWRKYRSDGKQELKQKIDDVQNALNLALEEGRVTDAGRLQKELSGLWDKYRKSEGAKAVVVCAVLSAFCAGCFSTRQKQEYIVIGERINIVEPGQEIVVPPLVPPAKKWYLVDNVGLAGWLGLPTASER